MNWGNLQTNVAPISIFGKDTKKASEYHKTTTNINKLLKEIEAFEVKHNMPRDRSSKDFEDKIGLLFNDGPNSVDKPKKEIRKISTNNQINDISNTISQTEKKFLRRDGSDIVMDVNNLPEEKQSSERQFSDSDNSVDDTSENSDDTVCVKKVMQISETVYEDRVVCHHRITEKCHHTFLTDYVPTQERQCQTSYHKKCHIQYKPTVSMIY